MLLVHYTGEIRNFYRSFGQRPKEKTVYERLQFKWEENIKMCLKVGLDSFCSEERQIVDTWDHDTEYLVSIKCWEYFY